MALSDRPNSIPSLADFRQACESAFGFLVREHGFEACEPECAGHEYSLAYRKPPNLVLDVQYEPGGPPWIVVKARLDARARRTFVAPLHRLARARGEGWRPPRPGDGALEAELDIYAELLKTAFPDVLEAADGIGRRLKEGKI